MTSLTDFAGSVVSTKRGRSRHNASRNDDTPAINGPCDKNDNARALQPTTPQPNRSRTGFLDLPPEIIQENGLCLPYASETFPLQYTCRAIYCILSDNHFWFRRRRSFPYKLTSFYYDCRRFTGIVQRDMEEPYDSLKDYRALVLRAYQGKTGERVNGVPIA